MNNSQDTILEYLRYTQHFTFDNYRQEFALEYKSQSFRGENQYEAENYKKFARYTLPHNTHHSRIDANEAPHNITLVRTEDGKCLLIQKIFHVRITKQSHNNPFLKTIAIKDPYASIRMLIGLPNTFSLNDAIILGESPFWQEPDINKVLSLKELRNNYINNFSDTFNPSTNAEMIRTYIPFIVRSYLLQQSLLQHSHEKKPRILIIASPDIVARLIKTLNKCIPSQLLQKTTFSTYEDDFQNQKYDICGTCLLQKDENKYVAYLKPSTYENDFVLDTYAPRNLQTYQPAYFPSDLEGKARKYAEYAAKAFELKNSYHSLRVFIRQIESLSELSIDTFLEQHSAHFHTPPQETKVKTTGEPQIHRGDPTIAPFQPAEPNRQPKKSAQNQALPASPASPVKSYQKDASSLPSSTQPAIPSGTFGESKPPVTPAKSNPVDAASRLPHKQPSGSLENTETLLHRLIPQVGNSPIPQIPGVADNDLSGPTQQLVEPPSPFSPGIPGYTDQATFPAKDSTSIQEQINARNNLETLAANTSYPSQIEPTNLSNSPETIEEYSLSYEKIIEALEDPRQAKKLLENEQKRERMIEYMLNNTVWTEQYVAPAWTVLRNADKISRKLASAMESLIHDIHDITVKSIQKGGGIRFQRSLFILPLLSPYKDDDNAWRDFFTIIPSELKDTPLSPNAWFFRKIVLKVALEALYPDKKEDDKIVQKLLEVAPDDFSELISESYGSSKIVSLPPRWCYIATRYFVDSITPNHDLVLRKNIQFFITHKNIVETLFKFFVMLEDFTDKWTVISKFFKLLVDNGYAGYSKPILLELLATPPPQNKASEFIVSLYTQGLLTPEDYLHIFKLDEALCIKQFASHSLFQKITLESLPRLPLTWERMNALYLMLEKWQVKKINAVIENLAGVLNTCIDSPIRLGILFSSLTQQDNATARLLLHSMARQCRDDITEPISVEIPDYNDIGSQQIKTRFAHYMQFLLNPDGPYYNNAIKEEMLNELLANPDERIASFITDEAEYWPTELLQAWEHKRKNYMPSPQMVAAAIASAPINNSVLVSPVLPAALDPDLVHKEEMKMKRLLQKLFKTPSIHNLARFWQENYIALQILIKQTQDQDIKDSFYRLQRAYKLYQAIENANQTTHDSQGALESAILQAYNETVNYHDGLRPTRRESNRLALASEHITP